MLRAQRAQHRLQLHEVCAKEEGAAPGRGDGLLVALGHRGACFRQSRPAQAVRLWRARAGVPGAPVATARRPLPLATEAGPGPHLDGGGDGEAAGGPGASPRTPPHLLPRRLRPQCRVARRRHAALASIATHHRRGHPAPENQAPPPGLGHGPSTHLRHRRLDLPLRRWPHCSTAAGSTPSSRGRRPSSASEVAQLAGCSTASGLGASGFGSSGFFSSSTKGFSTDR